MIFGWVAYGRTDRWVLVDAIYPHPALHHAREAMRDWADYQAHLRETERSAGPRRMPWPCKSAVKETGDVELRIWPCGIPVLGVPTPRVWVDDDRVWRPAMAELAICMAASGIACSVEVIWMNGGGVIEREVTSPGLVGRRGFFGWRKGEHEPKRFEDKPAAKVVGKDLRIMPQGEHAWH